ncbi:metallophosphoesterase [Candidatus Woesebacteria bacterium]|nr:metallophosphoesterase [Candidatus Woesebacteria bacterium]
MILMHGFARDVYAKQPPDGTLKVAFVGDVGVKSSSRKVMRLVKSEGAQLLVIVGDFDYHNDPTRFFNMVRDEVGGDIPVLIVIGNHDIEKWGGNDGYQQVFQRALAEYPGLQCSGDFGINATCTYKGVSFLLSGATLAGRNHEAYLTEQLSNSSKLWNVCVWHIAHEKFQVGSKEDNRNVNRYEICRNAGAMIVTAHEHSYQRTKTLSSMTERTVSPQWSSVANLAVGPGLSFVTVTGAGGESLRSQTRCLPSSPPYGCNEWASIYTSSQNAKFGVQFVTFGDGGANKASGYFKNTDGAIIDQFTIANLGQLDAPPPTVKRGDFTGDGLVNLFDYNAFLPHFNTVNAQYSLVGDSAVDIYDYNELLRLLR